MILQEMLDGLGVGYAHNASLKEGAYLHSFHSLQSSWHLCYKWSKLNNCMLKMQSIGYDVL